MKKQNLIDSIKKDAFIEIKAEIKNSVVKEMFGTSKKEIKKLKKKILKELKEEMFAEVKASKNKKKKKIHNISEIVINLEDENKSNVDVEDASEDLAGRIFEYKGFKFDVDRMSSIVTGKLQKENKTKDSKKTELTDKEKKDLSDMHKLIGIKERDSNKIPTTLSSQIEHLINTRPSPFSSINKKDFNTTFPSVDKKVIKSTSANVSEEKKEEISFFIGKLKEGIDKLKESDKDISYRFKRDSIYTFSYEKTKSSKHDFSFKFDMDLDIYTYGAKINKFEFNFDGFKFDKGFVEILDIIEVLEIVGMNLMKYIKEIGGINTSAELSKRAIKNNIKDNIKTIRANTKLSKFIFNQRILKVLQGNDINTYGQLKKIEELTSLKGVGVKTADKIEGYIKK